MPSPHDKIGRFIRQKFKSLPELNPLIFASIVICALYALIKIYQPETFSPLIPVGIGTLAVIGTTLLMYLSTSSTQDLKDINSHLKDVGSHLSYSMADDNLSSIKDALVAHKKQSDEQFIDLKSLVAQIAEKQNATAVLDKEEQFKFRQDISKSLRDTLSTSFVDHIETRYSSELRNSSTISGIQSHFLETRRRLNAELVALSRRGNLNLVIGILTTIVAVSLLGHIALSTSVSTQNLVDAIPSLLLRLSLAAFIEVFSFFFLRLYKQSLEEIKYFQNELTNVEMKFLALESALLRGDVAAIQNALGACANVERNFILKKGESTVEIQKLRLDDDLAKSVSRAIADAIAKASPS